MVLLQTLDWPSSSLHPLFYRKGHLRPNFLLDIIMIKWSICQLKFFSLKPNFPWHFVIFTIPKYKGSHDIEGQSFILPLISSYHSKYTLHKQFLLFHVFQWDCCLLKYFIINNKQCDNTTHTQLSLVIYHWLYCAPADAVRMIVMSIIYFMNDLNGASFICYLHAFCIIEIKYIKLYSGFHSFNTFCLKYFKSHSSF